MWALALSMWSAAATATPAQATHATTADRVAVRYFAAETGGIARPKWISARWLAFQATLEARGEGMRAASERHMRIALELDITETLLSLSPNERLLAQADEARLVADLRAEHERRVGGVDAFSQLATEFNVSPSQIAAWYARKARALHYADRMIASIRAFEDSEVRQSFRVHDNHEFGATFEEAREGLRRWLMVERFRALSSAHYQAARGRTKVVIIPH